MIKLRDSWKRPKRGPIFRGLVAVVIPAVAGRGIVR
jgi:hypothetical protein